LPEDAAQEGRLRTGSFASLARKENAASGITPTTTIRLDPDDISRARALAARRGLRYQTYLKMLVHGALAAEEKKLAG
jgi:predicted DNA binding CopG/RHH family protein